MQLIRQSENDYQVINKAEIDIQISSAKAYPRNIDECVNEAISIIISDQETAESCIYSLPRGKTNIEGPSIRLAEIAAYCFGNIRGETKITGNDGHSITATGMCWDVQKNIAMSAEIKRSIKTKDGRTYNTDMQIVTGNAAASIALRNAIFRVIPKHIINNLYNIAVKSAVGDQKSMPIVRLKAITQFEKRGISRDIIFSYFNISAIDELTKEHITTLIGKHNAIKDGQLKIDEAFSKIELDTQSESDDINEKLGLNKSESNKEWLNDFDKTTGELKS